MKKSAFFIFASTILSLLIYVSAHAQEDMLMINNDTFNNPQRSPAVFHHEKHNEAAQIEACNKCHHVYDKNGKLLEDESSEDQACSDCHELEDSGRKLSAMKAFHTRCKGCHEKRENGPVMCGQCHVRKPVSPAE